MPSRCLSRATWVRYVSLASQGAVSRQQLELVGNGYVAATDQVRLLKQQRAEALARSSAAAKLLALARSQLGKTIINAPRSGAVLERLAEPGEVIAAGQPIAVIADISRVRLKIYVGERDLGRVRLDAPVRIHIDAFAGRNFEGRVTRVDAQAQFTPRDVHMQDERSRTVYGVRLEAANPESLLKPGMPADAWILWDEKAGWPATLRAPE